MPFRVHRHSAETDIHDFLWTRNFNIKLLTDFSIHPLPDPFKSSQNLNACHPNWFVSTNIFIHNIVDLLILSFLLSACHSNASERQYTCTFMLRNVYANFYTQNTCFLAHNCIDKPSALQLFVHRLVVFEITKILCVIEWNSS